jgi:nucleotide-binding universal stress UspA family protein
MAPSFVVLTDLSLPAKRAVRYAAAVAAPFHAQLNLLHIYHELLLHPELASMTISKPFVSQPETTARLQRLAQLLPVSAEVSEVESFTGMLTAIRRCSPLLLVMGINKESDLTDQLIEAQLLPLLRATRLPVLLIPEVVRSHAVPQRIAVAVDDEDFVLTTAAQAVFPLLNAWQSHFAVVQAVPVNDRNAYPREQALASVQTCGLLPPDSDYGVYTIGHSSPGTGIVQAIAGTQAEMLVLITRPRSFCGPLFQQGVTAQVIRRSSVPVLLLPAED